MTRSYVPLLVTLAAIWGASYLFIKVAVEEIEPAPLMDARLLIASLLLVAFLTVREGARSAASSLGRAWRPGLVLGFVNAAVPFTLIAWGEKHVDSGVAAIANATVPIFVALLAIRFSPSERLGGARLAGVIVGLAGVAVLAGGQPEVGLWPILGTLAVVLASFSYGIGGLYGQLRVHEASGPVLATASMIGGTVLLLPLAVVTAPTDVPGWKAIGSVLALGILGLAVGQLILFRMLRLFGASRASLVTYLMPLTAVFYGVAFLDERITAGVAGGLVLILAGVALGSGGLRLSRGGVRTASQEP